MSPSRTISRLYRMNCTLISGYGGGICSVTYELCYDTIHAFAFYFMQRETI